MCECVALALVEVGVTAAAALTMASAKDGVECEVATMVVALCAAAQRGTR